MLRWHETPHSAAILMLLEQSEKMKKLLINLVEETHSSKYQAFWLVV